MAQGTVKWFSPEKGFGFIVVDDKDGEELFVHFSEIKMDGYRTLEDGERVEDGERGEDAPEEPQEALHVGRLRAKVRPED